MTVVAERARPARSPVVTALLSRENTLLGVLIAFAAVATIAQPRFIEWSNIVLILQAATVLGVVAIGEFLVIVSGAIDISIGAIVAVSTLTLSVALRAGVPSFVAVVFSVLVAAAVGSVNGALVAVVRLPSVVVTLATLGVIRGLLALFFSSTVLNTAQGPLGWLWSPFLVSLPPAVFVFAGLALLCGALLRWTQFGHDIFAVGSNESAARVAGVGIRRTRVLTFAAAGLLAGVAGVLIGAQQAMVQLGQAGSGFEFLAIGAVVLGGADIFGGSGRVRGTVIGILLLYSVYNAMVLTGIPPAWQDSVVGALILISVIIDTHRNRLTAQATS